MARTPGPLAAGGRGQSQLLRSQVLAQMAQGGHSVAWPASPSRKKGSRRQTVVPTRAEPEPLVSWKGPHFGKAPVHVAPWAGAGQEAGGTWTQANQAQDAAAPGALRSGRRPALRPRAGPSLPRSPAEVRPLPPGPACPRDREQLRGSSEAPQGSGLGVPTHSGVSPNSEAGGRRLGSHELLAPFAQHSLSPGWDPESAAR